jgi:anti-anti-sigma factor
VNMRIDVDMENDLPVLRLGGELTAGAWCQELETLFDKLRDTPVIVELSKITYVNSSGIQRLLQLAKMLSRKGGGLALVGLPSMVARVFEVSKLYSVFPVFGTIDEALATFALPDGAAVEGDELSCVCEMHAEGEHGGLCPAITTFSPVFELLREPLIVRARSGRILYCNPPARDMLKAGRNEALAFEDYEIERRALVCPRGEGTLFATLFFRKQRADGDVCENTEVAAH